MDGTKFVGMDVHQETISIAVMNSAGKVIMESIVQTKAITILQFIQGLRGDLSGLRVRTKSPGGGRLIRWDEKAGLQRDAIRSQ
jgi:hypothetical protein